MKGRYFHVFLLCVFTVALESALKMPAPAYIMPMLICTVAIVFTVYDLIFNHNTLEPKKIFIKELVFFFWAFATIVITVLVDILISLPLMIFVYMLFNRESFFKIIIATSVVTGVIFLAVSQGIIL